MIFFVIVVHPVRWKCGTAVDVAMNTQIGIILSSLKHKENQSLEAQIRHRLAETIFKYIINYNHISEWRLSEQILLLPASMFNMVREKHMIS